MIKSFVVVLGLAVVVPAAGFMAGSPRHEPTLVRRFLPFGHVAGHARGLPRSSLSSGPPPRRFAARVPVAPAVAGPRRADAGRANAPAGLGVRRGAVLGPADLRLTITAPATVRAGAAYTYTIRVANRGPAVPSEVTVRNTLPAGVVRTGAGIPRGVGGYAGGSEATLVLPRIAAGRSVTVTLNVRVARTALGTLVARGRIVYTAGARLANARAGTATAASRVA